MKFTELPKDFQEHWQKLGRSEQKAIIACLHNNTKKQIYRLKVKAEVNEVAKTLTYIQKHKITYTADRQEESVIFSFQGLEDRNAVLLGRNMV